MVYITKITKNLSILCILVYFIDIITGYLLTDLGILDIEKVLQEKELYRIVTCMFLHNGLIHLTGNLILFNAIGHTCEKELTPKYYFLMLVLSGITANIYYLFTGTGRLTGFSGVVYSVVGSYLVLEERKPQKIVLMSCCISSTILSIIWQNNTAYIVHFVGFICGIILSLAIRNKDLKENKYIKIYAIIALIPVLLSFIN